MSASMKTKMLLVLKHTKESLSNTVSNYAKAKEQLIVTLRKIRIYNVAHDTSKPTRLYTYPRKKSGKNDG